MPGYSELVEALKGGKGPGDFLRAAREGAEKGAAMSQEERKRALLEKVASFKASELGPDLPPGIDPQRPLSENAFLSLKKGTTSGDVSPEESEAYLEAVNTGRSAIGMPLLTPDQPLTKGAANALLRGMSVATQAPQFGAEKTRQVGVVKDLPILRDVSLAVNRVTKAWRPEFTGPGDALSQEAASLTGNANPQYVNMVQGIASAFNKIAKAQSGAVINQEELKRLAEQFPRNWRSDTDFVARMNAWIDDFNNVVEANTVGAGPNVAAQYRKLRLAKIPTAKPVSQAPASSGATDEKTRRLIELGLIEGE